MSFQWINQPWIYWEEASPVLRGGILNQRKHGTSYRELKGKSCSSFLSFFFFHSFFGKIFIFYFYFFNGSPLAYRSSQARGRIRAAAAGLRHSHSLTGSKVYLQLTRQHCGNARSLTQRARQGIEPMSSNILIRFVIAKPQLELPYFFLLYLICNVLSISTVQQSDPVTHKYIYIIFLTLYSIVFHHRCLDVDLCAI